MDFSNRNVLVTGASSGIGRAIAQGFADHHGIVAVHYHRNRTGAEETLAALPGAGHQLMAADLRDPDSVRPLIDRVCDELGSIDVLVNNAGIFERHLPVDVDYDEWTGAWRRTLETNLIGPANLAYWASKRMIAQGGGSIVNISSRGAFRGEPEAPAYGASKAGLNAMSQSMAKALAPKNVFVTAVAPGYVETDRVAPILSGDKGDAIRAQSPLGRVARPEEVAAAVLFLASDDAQFMTGAIVDVNGASYLRS